MNPSPSKKKDKHIYEHDLLELGKELMRTLASILSSKILRKRFLESPSRAKKHSLNSEAPEAQVRIS